MSGMLRTMRRRMVRDAYGAGALPSKKFGRQGRLFRPDGTRHIRAEKPVLNTPPKLDGKPKVITYYEALVKLGQRLSMTQKEQDTAVRKMRIEEATQAPEGTTNG